MSKLLLYISCALLIMGCRDPKGQIFLESSPEREIPILSKGCFVLADESHETQDLVSAAQLNKRGESFVEFLVQLEQLDARLFDELANPGLGKREYTLLVPTDHAWEEFEKKYTDISVSGDTLKALVRQHILEGVISYEELAAGLPMAHNMNVENIRFSQDENGCIFFNQKSRMKIAEDICQNGIIHLIDQVIIPEYGF